MLTKKYADNYLQCLKEERYFDAHEALEALWFPVRFKTECAEVMLLKGFINAAVSFELVKRNRTKSALKVWKNYEKYIPLLSQMSKETMALYQHLQSFVEKRHATLHKT